MTQLNDRPEEQHLHSISDEYLPRVSPLFTLQDVDHLFVQLPERIFNPGVKPAIFRAAFALRAMEQAAGRPLSFSELPVSTAGEPQLSNSAAEGEELENARYAIVGGDALDLESLAVFITTQAVRGNELAGVIDVASETWEQILRIFNRAPAELAVSPWSLHGAAIDPLSFLPAQLGAIFPPAVDAHAQTLLDEAVAAMTGLEGGRVGQWVEKVIAVSRLRGSSIRAIHYPEYKGERGKVLIPELIRHLSSSILPNEKFTKMLDDYAAAEEKALILVNRYQEVSPGLFVGASEHEDDLLLDRMVDELEKRDERIQVLLHHTPDYRPTGLPYATARDLEARLEGGEDVNLLFREMKEALRESDSRGRLAQIDLQEDRRRDILTLLKEEIARATYEPDFDGRYSITKLPEGMDLDAFFQKWRVPMIDYDNYFLVSPGEGRSKRLTHYFKAAHLQDAISAIADALLSTG